MTQNHVIDLVEILNNESTNNIQLTLTDNKAELKWHQETTVLAIKNKHDTSTSSDTSQIKKPISSLKNRQAGPIYFQFSFKPVTSTETSFRANKFGNIFFTLHFNDLGPIKITSKLSAYSCVQKVSDSAPHIVQWSGDTYISFSLNPKKTADTIQFNVQGITISGRFAREDQKPIHKEYSKNLRKDIRQTFETFFSQASFKLKDNNNLVLVKTM
ncbi:hypothetical protein [Maribacter sp.]|uniref:hypothetical protein n=1 Tax=Maribacter sp. TaxID=1897614 RepID=UPI00329991B7